MLIYYIYAYLRSNGTPYYIGKGHGDRAWSRRRNINRPIDSSRIIILEKNLTEIGAFALERRLIRWWGRKIDGSGILANINPGGEGSQLKGSQNGMYGKNHTPITKAKQSAKRKGKTWEEIYGIKGAEELKKKKTGKKIIRKDYTPTKHSRYDHTEYTFFNYTTGQLVSCTKYSFRSYVCPGANIREIINKGWCSHNWGLLFS